MAENSRDKVSNDLFISIELIRTMSAKVALSIGDKKLEMDISVLIHILVQSGVGRVLT